MPATLSMVGEEQLSEKCWDCGKRKRRQAMGKQCGCEQVE